MNTGEQEWLASTDPQALRLTAWPRPHCGERARRLSTERKARLFCVAAVRASGLPLCARAQKCLVEAERKAEQPHTLWNLEDIVVPFGTEHYEPGNFAAIHSTCLIHEGDAAESVIGGLLRAGGDPAALACLIREVVGNPFRMIARWQPDWGNEPKDWDIAFPSVRHFDTRCLTPTVLSLAQAAYDERGRKCPTCKGIGKELSPIYGFATGNVSETDISVVGYLPVMNSNCPACHGTGRLDDGTLDNDRLAVLADALEDAGCDDETILTHLRSPGPHVRGCWVVDLLLGKG